MHQLKDTKLNFVVVGKLGIVLTNTRFNDLPVDIQDMFNKHVDIVVDDFPNELPLVRIITHHIDLIPKASFPNKATYRMTPKENEEIRKQV